MSRLRDHSAGGSSPYRRRPVPVWWVLLGLLVAAIALVGVVTLAEALRPPFRAEEEVVPDGGGQLASDPRETVDCTLPRPREDRPRHPDRAMGPATSAVDVSSTALLDCPQTFDGLRVRLQGEVVGGLLERDEGAWVQLNDGAYADTVGPLPSHRLYVGSNSGIGVFVPDALAEEISVIGGPRTRGDVLTISGVFHRVDDASAEVAVVRARTGEVLAPGGPLQEPVLWDRAVAAGGFAVLAGALVGLERWVSRRRRR